MTELEALLRGETLLTRVDSTSRARMLVLPASGSLAELLHGCPPGLVYSNEEQRHCGRRRDLTGWAGRLAAKLAVADVLGLDADAAFELGEDAGLADIQILPQRQGFCTEGPGCLKPHPPQVRLAGRAAACLTPPPGLHSDGGTVQVSISHTRVRAIALAVRLFERSVETP
jgi:phosphopantetheinyl transferase (holo-ACP synthase)